MREVIFALIAGCLVAGAVEASENEIHRWVDADGVVHYGDRPPQDAQSEVVDVEAAPDRGNVVTGHDTAGPAPASPDAAPQLSIADQRRQERRQRREAAARENRTREINCTRMSTIVAKLEPRTNIIINDADGNPRRLDDEERVQAVADAKAYIAANCDED